MNHRSRRMWHRAAVLAAIAALAGLTAGCGSSAAPWPGQGPGARSSADGTGGIPGATTSPPAAQGDAHGTPGFVSPPDEQAGTRGRSGITGGALFGGTGQLTAQEGKLGRRLAIVRVYYRLGESFPTPADRQRMAAGGTLLVSLDTVPGQGPSYASIAAGHQDATIGAFLEAMNQAAVTYHLGAIYICFEHEADSPPHQKLGPPPEFIKAWDHVHQLARSRHLNWNSGGRLHWVMILEHSAYFRNLPPFLRNAGGGAGAYWPGTSEVDIVAADGYNHNGCKHAVSPGLHGAAGGPSTTPQALFGPALGFAHSHGGLPMFIAEWGSQASRPAQQVSFITQMQRFVSANPEIAAASYFDSRSAQNPHCSSIIDNRPRALSAMKTMGHSPALQGRVVSPA